MQTDKLQLYNSLSKEKEAFEPLQKGQVGIYSCGPTVYDSAHLGHGRSFVAWDVLVRYLRHVGYQVRWVRNITDIDDKILARAKEKEITPEKLARTETFHFWRDMHAMNVSVPDAEPRATENIAQIIAFIEGLIAKGHAYRASNDDVYFRVESLDKYGQLKHLANEEQNASRIMHAGCKDNNCDFALWKSCKDEPYAFDSPFGRGRPGWHIECSAMIAHTLGPSIDIHTGGEDLLFPHHENEIAQSEALHCCKLSNYWLHNGMILIDGQKMSKSLGNYTTLQSALTEHGGNALRLFFLTSHYRTPLNYTPQALEGASRAWQKIAKLLPEPDKQDMQPNKLQRSWIDRFEGAMNDDLNTACAMSVIFELAQQVQHGSQDLQDTLCYLLSVLGFDLTEKNARTEQQRLNYAPVFDVLLDFRQQARQNKDFETADRIRDALQQMGHTIRDTAAGSSVHPIE